MIKENVGGPIFWVDHLPPEGYRGPRMDLNFLIEKYLSYQDTPLSEDEKKATLKAALGMESSNKYATILQSIRSWDRSSIEDMAEKMRIECLGYLEQLGVKSSAYGQSGTWAVWDIAKQLYMLRHPEESDSTKYHLGNPFTDERVRQDIVDRHLGWELDNYLWEPSDSELSHLEEDIDNIYLSDHRPDGESASYTYTKLGRIVREEIEKK